MQKRRLEKRNILTRTSSSERKIKIVIGKMEGLYQYTWMLTSSDKFRRRRDPIKLLDDPLDIITSHKKKKEKKKYERDRKYHKEVNEKKSKSTLSSIEELRAKRLERERNEKLRVKQLYLGPNMIEEADVKEEEELDDRKRGYNSQFNREETSEAKNKKRRRY